MRIRVIVGVLIAAATLTLLWLDHQRGGFPWGLSALYVFGISLGMREFLQLHAPQGSRYPVLFCAGLAGTLAAAHVLELWKQRPLGPGGSSAADALLVAYVVLFMIYEVLKGEPERFRHLAVLVLAFFYIFTLGHFSQRIRHLPAFGEAAFLWYLVVGKSTDAWAYFTGKAVGRHKLIPKVSPAKTIEGSLGGLVLGCASGLLVWHFTNLHTHFPLHVFIPLSLAVQIVGQFGDLVESLLKRSVAAKDSAPLLPGMGGVLDIIDCLLLSAPAAFYGLLVAHHWGGKGAWLG
jgi:phosphatidate cytidylyltransferase